MKINPFFLVLMLSASPVWACDSYEDCMQKTVQRITKIDDKKGWALDGVTPDNNLLRAIAYKLDEISKNMDHSEKFKEAKELREGSLIKNER